MSIILYATTNPGKFAKAHRHFAAHGVEITSPEQLGITKEVEETGSTLEENAILKARAYHSVLPEDSIVIGDDTGIEPDALGGEPGIKVRHWLGRVMTDQAIIDYTIKRMKKVTRSHRGAQFRTVLAIVKNGQEPITVDGVLRGQILEHPTHREIAISKAIAYLATL